MNTHQEQNRLNKERKKTKFLLSQSAKFKQRFKDMEHEVERAHTMVDEYMEAMRKDKNLNTIKKMRKTIKNLKATITKDIKLLKGADVAIAELHMDIAIRDQTIEEMRLESDLFLGEEE